MAVLDHLPGRMSTIAGFLNPVPQPRRSVREISRELEALADRERATRGTDAWQGVADHGSDLGLELIASFERETGVDFNQIRSFL